MGLLTHKQTKLVRLLGLSICLYLGDCTLCHSILEKNQTVFIFTKCCVILKNCHRKLIKDTLYGISQRTKVICYKLTQIQQKKKMNV